MTPPIAIIGAGPCGLTLARLLDLKGLDYVVYERDESETSNTSGGTLDLHPESGQCALKEAGLYEGFRKRARYEDTVFKVADKHGTRHIQVGEGRDAPEIDRLALRDLLLASIPKHKIKWGHHLQSAQIGANATPDLQFSNGISATGFKIVVGTDGAWSKIRSMVTSAKPKYIGKSYIESSIEPDNPIYQNTAQNLGAGSTTSISSGNVIIAQRQGNGAYRIYYGFEVAEHALRDGSIDVNNTQSIRDLLLSSNLFGDWDQQYKDFIHHATNFRGWPLYTLSQKDMNWTSVPGVTLAGDAAHLTIPNGEGVNLAMTDALELANVIAKNGMENLDQAIQEYETAMFARAAGSITEGIMMKEVLFSEDHTKIIEMLRSYMPDA